MRTEENAMMMLRNASPFAAKLRGGGCFPLGICLLAWMILSAPAAYASTTYTYAGNNFDDVQNDWNSGFTTNDSVNGFFVVEGTLAPNLVRERIPVLSLYFTDGHRPFTCGLGCLVEIWTNGAGDIEYWNVSVRFDGVREGQGIYTRNYDSVVEDGAYYWNWSPTDYGRIANSPGTWSSRVTATPEPASAVLISTALLVFGLAARKRVQ